MTDNEQASSENAEDCLGCRLIGGGAFLAASGYFWKQSRSFPAHKVGDRRFTAVAAVVFGSFGLIRLTVPLEVIRRYTA